MGDLIRTVERTAEADNSFSVTIGDGEQGQLLWAHLEYTSSADAGNRRIRIAMLDGSSNILLDSHAGANQAASLTNHYLFIQGIYRETAFNDNEIQVPIPRNWYFLVGYQLRIQDENAVTVNDSMIITYQFSSILT